jgi:hypothetical protein
MQNYPADYLWLPQLQQNVSPYQPINLLHKGGFY